MHDPDVIACVDRDECEEGLHECHGDAADLCQKRAAAVKGCWHWFWQKLSWAALATTNLPFGTLDS